jgi:hypothetical protein
MNKKIIGTIICAGLMWLGLQTAAGSQSISISGRGVVIRGGNHRHQPSGVVYKPGIRRYGGVYYRGAPAYPVYRENIVIYRHPNRDRYYRQRDVYVYPDGYSHHPGYYYPYYYHR